MAHVSKKAHRIFEDTYRDARRFLRAWPEHQVAGLSRMSIKDNERIYKETAKGIWACIESEKKMIALDKELGVNDEEYTTLCEKALEMVELTMERAYIV